MTACVKMRFPTKRLAKDYLKRRRFNNGLSYRHAYFCRFCGGWHLTSQRWRPQQAPHPNRGCTDG